MITDDVVRPPGAFDPSRAAYKDWLNLNVFDHAADVVGLVNVSIQGPPAVAETLVVGTALFDLAGAEWVGDVVPCSWADASVVLSGISTAAASVAFGDGGRILAAATLDDVTVRLTATPLTHPHRVEPPHAFGTGWIGWRVVPRLAVHGSVEIRAQPLTGGGLVAYHDHNWGRWHWGDDIGWEWGTFLGRNGGSIVAARTTDRSHAVAGLLRVLVDDERDGGAAPVRRSFSGRRARTTWGGPAMSPSRRLPGALAALHDDRRHPRLPSTMHLSARSGDDHLDLEFTGRSVAQLVLGDPMVVGYSFLHEISGHFWASGQLAGRTFELDGLGLVERLE